MIRSFSKHPYALQNQVQGYLRYGKNIAKKAEINRDFTNSDHYKQRMIDKFVNEKTASVPDSGLYVLIHGFDGQKKITRALEHTHEGVFTSGNHGTAQTEIQSFYSQQSLHNSPLSKSAANAKHDGGIRDNRSRLEGTRDHGYGKNRDNKEWHFLSLWENKSSSLYHREKLRMDQKKQK